MDNSFSNNLNGFVVNTPLKNYLDAVCTFYVMLNLKDFANILYILDNKYQNLKTKFVLLNQMHGSVLTVNDGSILRI